MWNFSLAGVPLNHIIGVNKQPRHAEYKNIKEFVHCIAFAHNCTFNSAIEMTPFEAGHGLPARTISEARMDLPRLQFTAEEGNSKTDGVKLWEQGLPKKVVDLAHEMER